MNGHCYRCHRVRDDVATRYDLSAFFLCDRCATLGRPSGLSGTVPRFRGSECVAHITRLAAQAANAGRPADDVALELLAENCATCQPRLERTKIVALVAAAYRTRKAA